MAHFLSLQQAVLRWSLEKWRDLTTGVLGLSQMGAKVVVDVKKE
jgi:hypothetical protein